MDKNWIDHAGRIWAGGSIIIGDRRVFNPSREQLIAAGYTEHEAQQNTPTIEEVRQQKIAEIEAYDTSEAVNSFILDGMAMWLPFELREKIRTRLPVEKDAGRDTTTLWYGTTPVELPIELAGKLLDRIELYAADCYDVTARHKADIEALDSIEAIEVYDYTAGYPEKPEISTKE